MSERARLRWALSVVVLAMFFGFVLLVSLAAPLFKPADGMAIPPGILLSAAFIVAIVSITGLYVHRSNARLDVLAAAVRKDWKL